MGYKFKSDKIELDSPNNVFNPNELPLVPNNGQICVDIIDKKMKVWNSELNRWIIVGDAEDIVFDNSENGFQSSNVQEAIEEARNTNANKQKFMLVLLNNGACGDVWLGFSENIPSNTTYWSPPMDVKIIRVLFVNKVAGTVENPIIMKIQAHGKSINDSGEITINDPIQWYITSEDSEKLLYRTDNGRQWAYNNSTEEDKLFANYKYAFRSIKLNGYGTPNDAIITLLLEEI